MFSTYICTILVGQYIEFYENLWTQTDFNGRFTPKITNFLTFSWRLSVNPKKVEPCFRKMQSYNPQFFFDFHDH